ncbi:hypothetical protein [Arthrobacter sp. Z1-15]
MSINHADPYAASHRSFMAGGGKYPMTILHDDGVYRHLRFDKPKEQGFNEPFHIITWPGSLAIRGGHGTYTFAREPDMFDFFKVRSWSINPSYWGEKLESVSIFGGYKEHDEDKFKAWLLQDFWDRRTGYTPAEATDIWQKLRWVVLDDGEYRYEPAARAALEDFETAGFGYSDLRDEDWTDYTSHYLWSLQAIVWGIRQYRTAKATDESETA